MDKKKKFNRTLSNEDIEHIIADITDPCKNSSGRKRSNSELRKRLESDPFFKMFPDLTKS